jgi:DNA-binding transcriptional MocR family regulator
MTTVSIEPAATKYASIANALQHRIDSGAYPVGAMLPSEAQLVREFDASRSTVVRALEYLRQLGYIEGVQGKGRVVLGRPSALASQPPGRVRTALHAAEAPHATLVGSGRAPASARIAATLAIPIGEPVIARQRLFPATETGWLMPAPSTCRRSPPAARHSTCRSCSVKGRWITWNGADGLWRWTWWNGSLCGRRRRGSRSC